MKSCVASRIERTAVSVCQRRVVVQLTVAGQVLTSLRATRYHGWMRLWMRRYLRFSLRSLLLAITVYSVLLVGFVRLGLVEALEILTFGAGILVLLAYLHREAIRQRHLAVGLGVMVHVLATPAVLVFAHLITRVDLNWWGVLCWTIAGGLMFPLALIHHFVCRYCGWYWGLAQPGTFFLVVVLNSLLWVEAWRSLRRKSAERAGRQHKT